MRSGQSDGVPRPRNFPEPFHEGMFRVREARDQVPSGSLRTLANPFHGVRAHADPETIAERFAALRLVCPGDLAVSHCTAAQLLNLPIPRECEHEDLHVMSAGPRIRRRGVVGHRGLGSRATTTVRGVPTTGLAQTWLDLAPCVGLDDLVVVGDAVAQRLGSTEPLRALTTRRVPGVALAREALEWIRVGSASPMETRSRVLFGRAGLPEPELNVDIHDPDGGWLATGDFVWREDMVVGEYQGEAHFGDYARGDKDVVRRRALEAIGWMYVDFTKDDYFRGPRRLELVRRVAGGLGRALTPEAEAAVFARPGLLGPALRGCGVR